jgi:hypothetical protein
VRRGLKCRAGHEKHRTDDEKNPDVHALTGN